MNRMESLQNTSSRDCPDGNPPSEKGYFANSIIFLGNGLLADYTLNALKDHFKIVFHAKTADDLAKVRELKQQDPSLHAVLASFGVLIKQDLLELFEPTGIINIHPSLLPEYRGASPIESAILSGDSTLGVSVMKLAKAMDAGPLYYQESIDFSTLLDPHVSASQALSNFHQSPSSFPIADAASIKATVYNHLAEAGANWLAKNLDSLPTPTEQNHDKATFCGKFDKSLSDLAPDSTALDSPAHLATSAKTAEELHREIIAFSLYPRSKIAIGGHETIVLASHIVSPQEDPILSITGKDGQILSLDRVQPAGKKPMDAKSFRNGYLK